MRFESIMDAAEIDVNFNESDLVLSFFSPFTYSRTFLRARASGVLLVAGVGSYCAYRICTRFLGQRFVWMLLESSHLDALPTGDRRLLYDANLPFDEDQEESEGDRASEDEWRERVTTSRPASQISRHSRFRQSTRKGLLAIRQSPVKREGVLCRRSNASGSQQSVASRSPSCSDRSASLRIVWEGGQDWDDEFANGTVSRGPRRLQFASQSSAQQPAPAMSIGDLCSVFDDVMSVTSALDHCQDGILFEDNQDDDDVTELDESQLSRIKCMTDSKYMYQSVIANSEFGSEMGSECGASVRSAGSNLNRLKKRISKDTLPSGLWSLAQEEPSTSGTSNQMTDSGLSRSTHSKKSSSGGNPSMFDSAIGTDVLSSEDESVELSRKPLYSLREVDSISIAHSELSMEWFDDGLRDDELDRRVPLDGLDWDMEDITHRNDSRPLGVSPLHRPSTSRDLMAIACQNYQPYSPQFKLIHQLYHKRRLKRVGGEFTGKAECADGQLEMFLSQALYHRCRVVHEESWENLEKRFSSSLAECDFLHRWIGRSERDLRNQLRALWDLIMFSSDYVTTLLHFENEVVELLPKLQCEFPSHGATDEQRKGLEVFLVLEGKKAYDEKIRGGKDMHWYTHDNPSVLMKRFEQNLQLDEVSWMLMTRCCAVTLEMVDATSVHGASFRCGSAPAVLTWIKLTNSTVPLYYVPDE